MNILDTRAAGYGVAIIAGTVAVYLVYRYVKKTGLGNVASNVAGGAVQSVGEAVGVPTTDVDKCAAAIDAENLWDVSLYCPASKFMQASRNRLSGLRLDGTPKVTDNPDQSAAETARLARYEAAAAGTVTVDAPDQSDAETARLARQDTILMLANDPDESAAETARLLRYANSDTSVYQPV